MLRTIAAVVIGLVVGLIFNMALVKLNMFLYPPPESFDWADTQGVESYVATLPTLAFIIVLI